MEEKANQEPAQEKKKPFGGEAYALLHDLVTILVIVTLCFTFLIRLVGVSGTSMVPTLHERDYLLVQSNFNLRSVKAGDVVVLLVPSYTDEPIVKRVIATEGQTVNIDFAEGKVYVDDVLLDEPYVNEYELYHYTTFRDYQDGLDYPITVPKDCIFVLGDNRGVSADSRVGSIGTVDTRRIVGKAHFIVFPFTRIGRVRGS